MEVALAMMDVGKIGQILAIMSQSLMGLEGISAKKEPNLAKSVLLAITQFLIISLTIGHFLNQKMMTILLKKQWQTMSTQRRKGNTVRCVTRAV
jgi:preprotein translocase subunit SecG